MKKRRQLKNARAFGSDVTYSHIYVTSRILLHTTKFTIVKLLHACRLATAYLPIGEARCSDLSTFDLHPSWTATSRWTTTRVCSRSECALGSASVCSGSASVCCGSASLRSGSASVRLTGHHLTRPLQISKRSEVFNDVNVFFKVFHCVFKVFKVSSPRIVSLGTTLGLAPFKEKP